MGKKFFIIDGSSMLSTAYYGNLPKALLFEKDEEKKKALYDKILHTSTGLYTNAIYTMLRTLTGIFKKVTPDYIAFVFDQSRDTFRRTKLGADFYKSNRKETPFPLKEQFIGMEQALQTMGFKVLFSEEYEADDYTASLVEKFQSPEVTCYVLTKDHDYFQLVSDYTRMWRPVNKDSLESLKENYGLYAGADGYDSLPPNIFEYTKDIVFGETGVYPEEITTLLSITGDSGDGIPGCKGVNAAAVPLIREYGTLENIYEAIEECSSPKEEKELAQFFKELGITRSPIKNLKENKDMVFLSRQLATMVRDIQIEYSLNDFSFRVNMDGIAEVLDKYELKSLKSEFDAI